MRKSIQAVFLIGLILTIFSIPCFALSPGAKAPDFELKNLDGETVRLSDYRGRCVLLKLGSIQCPSCKEQVDSIKKISDFLEEKDVVFIDIFLRDSREGIVKTAEEMDYPEATEILVGDIDVHRAYRVFAIPRVLLIDPRGDIVRDGNTWTAYDIKRRINKVCPDVKDKEEKK